MRILSLHERVIAEIDMIIAPLGGHVDPASVKQLSDNPESEFADREEIKLTLVFSKEDHRLAQYIEQCVRQATHSLCSYPGCQHRSLSLLQGSLEEAVLKSALQFAGKPL